MFAKAFNNLPSYYSPAALIIIYSAHGAIKRGEEERGREEAERDWVEEGEEMEGGRGGEGEGEGERGEGGGMCHYMCNRCRRWASGGIQR